MASRPVASAEPGFGDALPAIDRLGRLGGFCAGVGRAARQRHDLVAGRRPDRAAGRGIGIVGRPLAPGALTQHAAQPQENEHRQRQEDDGVDIEHVSHAPEAAVVSDPQAILADGPLQANPPARHVPVPTL